MCILPAYTLLKVVGYYDLSFLSMSVMCLKKKDWMGVGGWGELYPRFFLDFRNFFNFAKPLKHIFNSHESMSAQFNITMIFYTAFFLHR